MKKLLPLFFSLLFFAACNTEPQPIAYGHDACHFCEMTIVSPAYAAQVVSHKGKLFNYDAIECMVNDLAGLEADMAVIQVSDFSNPGNMIGVENVRFIINDSLNSPMGKNLAALRQDDPSAVNTFSWEELKLQLLQQNSEHINHH